MKGRTIKADILLDRGIDSLNSFHEVTYYRMRVTATSKGLIPCEAKELIEKLYPLKTCIKVDQMERCIAALLQAGLLTKTCNGLYVTCMMPESELPGYKADWEKKFETFYAEYPKKVCKSEARDLFAVLKPDEALFSKIMQSLKEHKKSLDWKKENGKFIPNPAKWLRRERWEDEVELPFSDKPYDAGIVDADEFFGEYLEG